MYKNYFGLKREPFGMTPDPEMLNVTIAQREALAGIMYTLLARRGFVALIGDAGTGKTTLLNKLMQMLEHSRAQFSVVFNPTLTAQEFLECVLADFGVEEIPPSKSQRLILLSKMLNDADQKHLISVLIVDEAHKLSAELLEEIRLLSNFERPNGKLLQIILAGQPQLAEILDRHELQQLKQRVAVRLRIGPLSAMELQGYISRRWINAGGNQHPFTPAAVERIQVCSGGIPRVVNAIADNALMLAVADGGSQVNENHVNEAANDLAFSAPEVRLTKAAFEPQPPTPAVARERTTSQTADVAMQIPSLERYGAASPGGSMISRLLGRFGWAN